MKHVFTITDGQSTRVLTAPCAFPRSWRIIHYERRHPVREVSLWPEFTASEYADLAVLAEHHNIHVMELLDRARTKFGRNINLKGLITAAKARGL